MTPTVLREGPYRFFFYSGEDRIEPPHVHVERDNDQAKFWLDPVRLADSQRFGSRELRAIERIVTEHREALLEAWHGYTG